MVVPSVVNNSSPGRSWWIGIDLWLVKVTNVSLAKQLDEPEPDEQSWVGQYVDGQSQKHESDQRRKSIKSGAF
jgi:hypothetical protein